MKSGHHRRNSSGSTRMKELGMRLVQLWLTEENHEMLKRLAAESGHLLTTFIIRKLLESVLPVDLEEEENEE